VFWITVYILKAQYDTNIVDAKKREPVKKKKPKEDHEKHEIHER
jgi:hypothetical protein